MDLPGAADGSRDADSLKNKTQSAESASRPPADDSSHDNSDEEHDAREQDGSAHDDEDEDEDDEEDEEDEEPRLKYVYLTKCLPSLYRAGDATSALLVAGDRMVQCPHYRKTGRA